MPGWMMSYVIDEGGHREALDVPTAHVGTD